MKTLDQRAARFVIIFTEVIAWITPIVIIGACLFFYATHAQAHDAPAGWSYDLTCCSNSDCREIKDDDVAPTPRGYLIKATGEVIPLQQSRRSKDEHFHRCSKGWPGTEHGQTICLYAPSLGN